MNKLNKIKRLLIATLLCMCILLRLSNVAYAFDLNTRNGVTALPMNPTYNYYISTYCSSTAFYPILNAINTWNSAPPTNFSFNLVNGPTNSNYTAILQDGISTIGTPKSSTELTNLGYYNSVAINFVTGSYSGSSYYFVYESDIVYNSSAIHGIGTSNTYYDWQGLFTHELGHSIGLGDVYSYNGTLQDLPTMWYSDKYPDGYDYFPLYYFRTLTTDDMNGKATVASIRDF